MHLKIWKFIASNKQTLSSTAPAVDDRVCLLITINCRSIKNIKGKLSFLLNSTQAGVVVGTEPWLDGSLNSSEIFPANYDVYRKDRNLRGRGAFLLVSKSLTGPALEFRDCVCESVWCEIKL